jgi:hypothetical protein
MITGKEDDSLEDSATVKATIAKQPKKPNTNAYNSACPIVIGAVAIGLINCMGQAKPLVPTKNS